MSPGMRNRGELLALQKSPAAMRQAVLRINARLRRLSQNNFGDVKHGTIQSDIIPSLATMVKHQLQIKNPKCVAYDILFGCPGWIEGVLQANAFIKSGMAKKCLYQRTNLFRYYRKKLRKCND